MGQKTKTDSNCGCSYQPLCNYDITRSYGGKIYKGIRNDDESVTYYNCENGIITKKWSISRYHDFHDEYYTYHFTRILLKENEKPGVPWVENAMDGRVYKRFITAKNVEFTMGDKVYKNVIVVREIGQVASDIRNGEKETIQTIAEYGNIYSDKYYSSVSRLFVYDNYYAKDVGPITSIEKTEEYIDSLKKKYLSVASKTNRSEPVKGTASVPDESLLDKIIEEVTSQYKKIETRMMSEGENNAALAGLWFCKTPVENRSTKESSAHLSFFRFSENGLFNWKYHLYFEKRPLLDNNGIWKIIDGKVHILYPLKDHIEKWKMAYLDNKITTVQEVKVSPDETFSFDLLTKGGRTISYFNLNQKDRDFGLYFEKISESDYKKIW